MNTFILKVRQRYAYIAVGGLAQGNINAGIIKERLEAHLLRRTTDAYFLDYEMMVALDDILIDQDVFVAGASIVAPGLPVRSGGIIGRPGIYEQQDRHQPIVRLNDEFSLLSISGLGGIVCQSDILERVYRQIDSSHCNTWGTYLTSDMGQSDYLWVSDGSGPGAKGFVAVGKKGIPSGEIRLF